MSNVSTTSARPIPDTVDTVIVGAGFGGLQCAQGLRDASLAVTLIDRTNYHLFQPLPYPNH